MYLEGFNRSTPARKGEGAKSRALVGFVLVFVKNAQSCQTL